MFRIRKLADAETAANRAALEQVRQIARLRFPLLPEDELADLAERLNDPLRYGYRSILFVAENGRDRVRGFALLLVFSGQRGCYLDLMASAAERSRHGIGTVLYERVREEALAQGAVGLFLEALPDDPALSRDPAIRRENQARLRFYEHHGCRPIIHTRYETPTTSGDDNPPYLLLDTLGRPIAPSRAAVQAIVRAILERKYRGRLPPGYTEMVLASFRDDPVELRPPRYVKPPADAALPDRAPILPRRIALVVTDRHAIHHVRERGYVEAPVRIRSILGEIERSGLFERVAPRHYGEQHIRAVHDNAYVDYLARACAMVEPGKSLYPYVFPVRNTTRPPKDLPVRAGYYCIDTFTPLNQHAFVAAKRAVDCALTAADAVLSGYRLAYALVRPPGHHAERHAFGGFCYFNNAAVAAQHLSRYGRVAVLDIDYHHGNGTQDIFYRRADVLTVSIHGHPSFAFPYFSGFRDEIGSGAGAGFNVNLPLPEQVDGERHREALAQALKRIRQFAPDYLVLAAGLDTAAGDPTGTFTLTAYDFLRMGSLIGQEGWPTLVVQEGGYRTRALGTTARQLFTGLWQGFEAAAARPGRPAPTRAPALPQPKPTALAWREVPRRGDVDQVRRIVASSGFFTEAEVAIAMELVDERLEKGLESGYHFLFAEAQDTLLGYACFGPTPGTQSSWDLYWIAVEGARRDKGFGSAILARAENLMRAAGAGRCYVETSSRTQYAPTRAFYLRHGYAEVADLADFYGPGDGKIILIKRLDAAPTALPPAV